MSQTTPLHTQQYLEHRYAHSPEKVFAAFSNPELKARWFAPPGPDGPKRFTSDFRVGGLEHIGWTMGSETPLPGAELASETLYLDIVTNRRIITGSNMKINGTPMSGSLITVEFHPEADGCRLCLTHQVVFLENSDGPEMREQGWRKLLSNLETLL
jgi:uncharacterized protein YndB with AHSA1/START domain